jgi:hypothetical protein
MSKPPLTPGSWLIRRSDLFREVARRLPQSFELKELLRLCRPVIIDHIRLPYIDLQHRTVVEPKSPTTV